jgi:hypothetical protein
MNHRLALAAALAALAVTVPGRSAQAQETPGDSRFDAITECIAAGEKTPEGAKVAVLFLIDTSQSLKKTDPFGDRVVGMKAALAGLREVVRQAEESASESGSAPKVRVYTEFLEFGTITRRTFPGTADKPDEWKQLTLSDADLLSTVADGYRANNNSEDADYVSALEPWSDRSAKPADQIGAIEMLERAPSDSCRLVVWFTDGKLDLLGRAAHPPEQRRLRRFCRAHCR